MAPIRPASDQIAPDQIASGIGLILLSTAAMALADALVKLASSELTVWQIFAVRSAFAAACLLALVRWQGQRMRTHSPRWVVVRSALLVACWLAYYASLTMLTLPVAAVAVYTNPIITTLLCALALGERVTARQWLGVLVGFAGVAVILRPGTAAFSWAIVLPLMAAVFYSLAMVLTRSKCQRENATALALWLHVAFIATGLGVAALLALVPADPAQAAAHPFLLRVWSAMDAGSWALLALLGILSAGYFLGVARAYQIAPPQIVGTFDYGYLVSAAVWSIVLFAEPPSPSTLAGIGLITVAGVLVAARAGKAGQNRAA